MRLSLALPAVFALILTGCQAAAPVDSEDEQTFSSTPRDVSSYYEQNITWDECDTDWLLGSDRSSSSFDDGDVECATVLVPAVYTESDEDVPDFELALMRRSPQDSDPVATVFINPGGPGVSGIEQVQFSEFPEEMRNNFDIVGFDPRGVNKSIFSDGTEIRCDDELDFVTYFEEGSPANEAELDTLIESLDRHYADCSENNPYWWTLSTENVAKDLDIIREVVTGEPLNFIGSSYGTTIAGRYVSLFPEQVGKIVFDSPTTVDTDRIASSLEKLGADEEKLKGFVEGYARNQEITFDEAWEQVLAVREMADNNELYGFAGIEPAEVFPDTQISSEALFTHGIAALNYLPQDEAQSYFDQGLFDAYYYQWNGTFEWFSFWLDGYDPESLYGETLEEKNIVRSNEFEVRMMVNTMDFSLPPMPESEQRELSAKSKEVAPLLNELYSDASGYEYFGEPKGLSWYQIALDDPAIPDPPSEPFIPSNPSGKPLLIIGSTNESVTPFSFAEDTAELLGSPLLAVESEIHAPAANYSNDCVNRILLDYLLDRADIVSTTCGAD